MTFSQPEQSSSQEPRRLLITGGAGFIGSNFVHHWCEHYKSDRVVVLDALTYAGNRNTITGNVGKQNLITGSSQILL